ncbi:hypothetical protein AZE42_07571 [Rhizopogon vesiculosus]|uniref:T6SS Phospholipase effector Tle1-like catalytic domain-containing protein n=1 Tax=Rhizopogon vesiculosus TaxID=180088 RepID=A0A1J8QFX3_9AGAM|nr:hypothetical protein AZE42_07571 [Rhizopogon vesiculosus]
MPPHSNPVWTGSRDENVPLTGGMGGRRSPSVARKGSVRMKGSALASPNAEPEIDEDKDEQRDSKRLSKLLKTESELEKAALARALKSLAALQDLHKCACKREEKAEAAQYKSLLAAQKAKSIYYEAKARAEEERARWEGKQVRAQEGRDKEALYVPRRPPRAPGTKRIVVCCDSTWQDGVIMKESWKHTNILKLSRALNPVDERSGVPIPQIVYYQTNVWEAQKIYSQDDDGATGASLINNVQEAYVFISQNYYPGDEIFLFGFSTGAYIARTVAMFIGAVGVLDQAEELKTSLSKWTSHGSRGKRRANSNDDSFSIKCVGVFDTVCSAGLSEELTHESPSTKSIFGFPNNELGQHIERAYHALAIDETRPELNCCKFQQTGGGRRKRQILKQCWFPGSHRDIGGGWKTHDLSDLTLWWMVANIGDMLSIDVAYITSLLDPVAPWGMQPPHK